MQETVKEALGPFFFFNLGEKNNSTVQCHCLKLPDGTVMTDPVPEIRSRGAVLSRPPWGEGDRDPQCAKALLKDLPQLTVTEKGWFISRPHSGGK